MKCVICDKRKAKRYCPAKRASICPVCCGEKRGVEINCPPDCKYFVEGQKHHQQKVMKQRLRREGAASYVRRAQLYNRNPAIFARIEKIIADSLRANGSIKNEDLVSAFELVKNTLETEKKGLIYQHQSDNRFANEISTRVLITLTEDKDSPDLSQDRVTLDYAVSVVNEFLKEVKFYAENDPNPQSYLIHILRYHPDEEAAGPGGGSELIITP
ncbi:MAG: hypothetical protein RIG61_02040 [Deltaproteobacteria bacterium]